jgi:hypothetical protein
VAENEDSRGRLQIEDFSTETYTVSRSDDPGDELQPFLVLENFTPFLSGFEHEEEARSVCAFLNAGIVLRAHFSETPTPRWGKPPVKKGRLPRFMPKPIDPAKLHETRKLLNEQPRGKEKGSVLVEMALAMIVLLTVICGAFDMNQCASAKSSLTWLATSAASGLDSTPGFDLAGFCQANAVGVGLNSANLTCAASGPKSVTATYTYQALFFAWPPATTLTANATAP